MTIEKWSGNFGNAYTERNRVDWRARVPFWKEVMDLTGARSVFEVGCNAGWNLSAIKQAAGHEVSICGCEPNNKAYIQAVSAGHERIKNIHAVTALASKFSTYEMVFTAGVLIHIDADCLHDVMQSIARASSDYVLCVEYESIHEVAVPYRDDVGLWRRPYGKLYRDMGLIDVHKWPMAIGFDNCTATLLRK